MNWWLKLAKKTKKKGVGEAIKERLRSSPFFSALFTKYDLSLDSLDKLNIVVQPLDGVHCKTGQDEIIVDKGLVDSKELFGPKFHYIAHEILHFIKRQVEAEHYFADPEEVEAFSTAMAYYIYENQGQPNLGKILLNEFLPLIKVTVPDDAAARKFYSERVKEAKELLSSMSLCNFS